jgi:hypothetical protein
MPFSVEFIRKLEKTPPELREILLALLEEVERQREESVTRREFQEFVRQTEENFQRVWEAIRELAEAQRRTEQALQEFRRATEEEFRRVWGAIEELAEAQKESEQRLTRLEKTVAELAEAQKRTEEELRKLAGEVRHIKATVAGLSDTVGYGLEDQIFPYMEDFVRKEYGVEVEVLDRRNVIYPDGRFDEINIYIEGRRDGKKVYIVGECKAKPGKKDIRRFSDMLERLRGHFGEEVEGFVVGYYFHPEVEAYLRQRYPDIRVFKSFEFRLRYKASVCD